jgi:hypothetical protein
MPQGEMAVDGADLIVPLFIGVPVVGVVVAAVISFSRAARLRQPRLTRATVEAIERLGFAVGDAGGWSRRCRGFGVLYRAPTLGDASPIHSLWARTAIPAELASSGDVDVRIWRSCIEPLGYRPERDRLPKGTLGECEVEGRVKEVEGRETVERPLSGSSVDWVRHTFASAPAQLAKLGRAEVSFTTSRRFQHGRVSIDFLEGTEAAEHFRSAYESLESLLAHFHQE